MSRISDYQREWKKAVGIEDVLRRRATPQDAALLDDPETFGDERHREERTYYAERHPPRPTRPGRSVRSSRPGYPQTEQGTAATAYGRELARLLRG